MLEGRVWGSTCKKEVSIRRAQLESNHAHLVVNQPPLLKERMDAHDRADISSKVATAGRNRKVLDGVESIGVDHKISVVLVDGGGLAAVPAIEEFGQGLLLYRVDDVHIKPGGIAGENNGMCLRDKV